MKKLKAQSSKLKGKAQSVKLFVLSFSFAVLVLSFKLCFAQGVSSTELINNAKQYDGQIVVYEGEAIGDIMLRGNFAWVNVSDRISAIGIWADKSLLKDITYTGSYNAKGDWLEVTGEFHRACPQHGGDLDIHAQQIVIKNPGREIKRDLNLQKRNFAIILAGILCLLLILMRLKLS